MNQKSKSMENMQEPSGEEMEEDRRKSGGRGLDDDHEVLQVP